MLLGNPRMLGRNRVSGSSAARLDRESVRTGIGTHILSCFVTYHINYFLQVLLRVDGLAKITKSAIVGSTRAPAQFCRPLTNAEVRIFIFLISLVVAERGVTRSRPARAPLAPVPTPAR